MKVFFYSYKSFEAPYLEAANKQPYETKCTQARLSLETAGMARDYDVVSIFTGDDASAPVVEALTKNGVRFIAIRASGFDNVDINKAHELGMKVANIPAYSPHSVAEHTVGMIMALNRKLITANKQVHDQNFAVDNLVGFDLKGKTVGIIGTGNIGSVVARILNGFGCHLIAYDIRRDEELELKYNVRYTDLDNLCSKSDIITIHTPLNENTRYIINKQQLQQMKKGVMLINTSRGALINTKELIEFIEKGRVAYFGTDVYEKEQGIFFFDYSGKMLNDEMLKKLMAMPNVLITPHQAFATTQALTNIADTTYYNIGCWARHLCSRYELPKPDLEIVSFLEQEF
jgi:D-lactate dehydrogenase